LIAEIGQDGIGLAVNRLAQIVGGAQAASSGSIGVRAVRLPLGLTSRHVSF
jgi:hypothetical protein